MYQPSKIKLLKHPPKLSDVDFEPAYIEDKKTYEKQLKELQHEMLRIQQAYFHQNQRAIVVFEGWDASGKGGAIRRLTEKLDPRGYKVYPIGAPTADEQGRHYLYRFQSRLPLPGNLCIFDRSYYGRVLVERVEGLATEQEWQRAYQEINEFERMLIDDGVHIIKLFLHIDKEEQLHRFDERLHNPVKRWKLTEEDIRNHLRWDDYEDAIEMMLQQTSTEAAPWQIIPAKKKWFARVNILETIVKRLSKGIDLTPPPLDDGLIKAAEKHLGITPKE
ncbi:polyphosphate kinase [Paraneptunicella aestuarii]|uniref:polyphosphate kinase 2 family protein n=1 Tax=Paraneptunicella aestuarii TaxID=2831148 RepID=UPI001E5BDB66|nr:polyphosphate kinase [Paraneptunicella aestuarii]UAA38207.1 polyphosphate kinase [Paraneptunicella aestuarii]